MKGLGAEIAKNLILAGVKGLTMLDHEQVRVIVSLPQRGPFTLPPVLAVCWDAANELTGRGNRITSISLNACEKYKEVVL